MLSFKADFEIFLKGLDEINGFKISNQIDNDFSGDAIVLNVGGGFRDSYYINSFGLLRYDIEMNIYSTDFIEKERLVDALVARLHGFSGEIGDSSRISRFRISSVIPTFENDSNPTIYRSIILGEVTV